MIIIFNLLFILQLSPATDKFELIGVNRNQNEGNFVIQEREYPIRSDYLDKNDFSASVSFGVNVLM